MGRLKGVMLLAMKVIWRLYVNRGVRDYFESKSVKRVLISYIVAPFRAGSHRHTNFYEVVCAAEIFRDMGYSVDVINYNARIPRLDEYSIIYGFGDVFRVYFEGRRQSAKTIYYGAGMHVCHQNAMTLLRAQEFYLKKRAWALDSTRFVEKTWTHQTSLVDGIIALGDRTCADSYKKFFHGRVISLNAPFFKFHDGIEAIRLRKASANKSFLWIGSSGAIHKGLDLCLDFFASRNDLSLHICGLSSSEKKFADAYRSELTRSNIVNHGFVDIKTIHFWEILRSCSFVIFPSCSEGGSPSVLTAIGNGALIPIVSRESSVSTGFEIVLKGLNIESIEIAVSSVCAMSNQEVVDLQVKNYNNVCAKNSIDAYRENLKLCIGELLQ